MILPHEVNSKPPSTGWSQVPPIAGTNESPTVYRSGQVTDIDVSSLGTAVTTAWGGYFLGGFGFLPRSDTIPTGKTRSIARYPRNGNIAVIATGSRPSDAPDDWGLGLYYTANAGVSWDRALPAGYYSGGWLFEKVRWGSNGIVYAASNRGLYRSTDYGRPGSWFVVFGDTRAELPASDYSPSTDVLDIAVDPAWPDTVYMVTGDGRLLRSTANGRAGTWITNTLPLTRRDGSRFDPTMIWRGTRIAIPKLNPNRVHLMVASQAGLYGMFHSTNYGDGAWTADDLGNCGVWPIAFMSALAASPVNSNLLLAGGGNGRQACRSSDGGSTWSALGPGGVSIHADHRAIAFNSAGMAFIGGDGGIFSSTDQGVNWSSAGSLAMSAPTIKSFDVSAADPSYLYMATWDTGLWSSNGRSFWISTHQDTTDMEADPTNALRAWGSVGQVGSDRFATVNGGLNYDAINGNLPSEPFPGAVLRMNGRSSLFTNHLNAVYSTTVPQLPRPSGGIPVPNWIRFPSAATPDFSGIVAGLTVNRPLRNAPLVLYAWIYRAADHTLPNKLYVYNSSEAASTIGVVGWQPVSAEFPSLSQIVHLSTSADGQLAYATTEVNSILMSSDYGRHWSNVAGNTPADITDILIDPVDPTRIFVATRHGVYRSTTRGVWEAWSLGLPFVDGAGAYISQLRAVPDAGATYLYAGVKGRGIFRRITSDP
jgi:photosystem II stability/assembly factor-like uncharacterized protein